MEIKREKLRELSPLAEPGTPDNLRVRQMHARDLLRGDLPDDEQAPIEIAQRGSSIWS